MIYDKYSHVSKGKTRAQISNEELIQMRLGKGWDKNTSRKSRPAPMEKILDYIADIYDSLDDDDDRLTADQLMQLIMLTGEVDGRSAPKDIMDAIVERDTFALRHMFDYNKDDRCWYCGTILDNEDYHTHTEREEYWGAPAYREVVDGYHCHNCGEEE